MLGFNGAAVSHHIESKWMFLDWDNDLVTKVLSCKHEDLSWWSHMNRAHINTHVCALVITDCRDRDREDPWSLLSDHSSLIGQLLEVGSLHRDGQHVSLLSILYTQEQTCTLWQCWRSLDFGRNWEDGMLKGNTWMLHLCNSIVDSSLGRESFQRINCESIAQHWARRKMSKHLYYVK
jgi:hypothetical protein